MSPDGTEVQCFVCHNAIKHSDQLAYLDCNTIMGKQKYGNVLEMVLCSLLNQDVEGGSCVCTECQKQCNAFEHHQFEMKNIQRAMVLKFQFRNGQKVSMDSASVPMKDSELCIHSSCDSTDVEPTDTKSSSPGWKSSSSIQQKEGQKSISSKRVKCGVTRQPVSAGQSAGQSRSWTLSADGCSYQCTLCDKTFAHRTYMYHHVRVHTGARPHECAECARAFRSSSALAEHTRSAHSSGAQFSCDVCGRTFVHSSSLRQHLARHRRAPAHACADCGKRFHRASQLREHGAVHSALRPFVCGDCGKALKTRSGLAYHARIHSGVKPHQCAVCRAAFRTSSNLARHVVSQHGAAQSSASLRPRPPAAPPPVRLDSLQPVVLEPPPPPPPAMTYQQVAADDAGVPQSLVPVPLPPYRRL